MDTMPEDRKYIEVKTLGQNPFVSRVVIDAKHPWLAHHVVKGRPVLPGAVWIHLVMELAKHMYPSFEIQCVFDVAWLRPIVSSVQVEFYVAIEHCQDTTQLRFTIDSGGQRCGTGRLSSVPLRVGPIVPINMQAKWDRGPLKIITRERLYHEFLHMGIGYGAYFRKVSYVQRCGRTSFAVIGGNGTGIGRANLMDCAFQGGLAISIGEHQEALMPYSLGRMIVHHKIPYPLEFAYVVTRKDSEFRTSFTAYNDDCEPLLSVSDLGVKPG